MVRRSLALIAALTSFAATSAGAACEYPDTVQIPGDASKSREQIMAAKTMVENYMRNMNDYLACLDEEARKYGKERTDEQKMMHTKRHNSAVDSMEKVAASFNEQLRAYKSANR